MILRKTEMDGLFLAELERRGDNRGFFARQYCSKEFESLGLKFSLAQANCSFSSLKGTLRGMHFQLGEATETKLVRCIKGALWDCVVDLREYSPSFGRWFGTELNSENRKMLVVPKGFAHGFITLTNDTEILYLVDEFYCPEKERGVRWNDSAFNIKWPIEPVVISEKDSAHPDFAPGMYKFQS